MIRFPLLNGRAIIPTSPAKLYEMHPREMYDLLRAYYFNNGLYDVLRAALYEVGMGEEALKPLRNPASRVVEFYAAKVWPGTLPAALPIVARNEAVIKPLQRIWRWSNWAQKKQVAVRWMAIYGDLFIKVVGDESHVYFQLIEPRYVTDITEDERGYLTSIRIDVPQGEAWHTENWTRQVLRIWKHRRGPDASLDELGQPDKTVALLDAYGIDFVPIVHIRHRDVGEMRGVGAYTLALDKIDEANRQATRLHQMLFRHNRNLWALKANALDAMGRPLPAPILPEKDDGTLRLGDDYVLRLPGNSSLESLVPKLDYGAALNVLNAQLDELEHDLPELAYYRLRDRSGDLSGRAVRMILSDAVDRLLEARGNAEAGLVQADAMALTIGTRFGLWDVGSYEQGDFEHSFAPRPVIAPSENERAETMQLYVSAGVPLRTAARRAGWSEDEIAQMLADLRAERLEDADLARAYLDRARQEFDQEGANA